MSETRVGVRELKERLSEYLRQVKAGQTVVITEHGRPVGRIVPEGQSVQERLQAMIDAGLAEWSGERIEPGPPVARARGERTVADLVVEDRQ